jgi:hypothetical protein
MVVLNIYCAFEFLLKKCMVNLRRVYKIYEERSAKIREKYVWREIREKYVWREIREKYVWREIRELAISPLQLRPPWWKHLK